MNNKVLDYKSILERCGVGSAATACVVNNIANLEEFYDSDELVEIYNYCLLNIHDPDILVNVIKYTNDQTDPESLSQRSVRCIYKDNQGANILSEHVSHFYQSLR